MLFGFAANKERELLMIDYLTKCDFDDEDTPACLERTEFDELLDNDEANCFDESPFDDELESLLHPTANKSKFRQLPYDEIFDSKLKEGETPLGNVVGLETQKKELLLVIDWFKRSKELKAKGVSIPKGVILFGKPGNGKSLLIKEIINCCEAHVFIFQGGQNNIVEGINETFKKAKEVGHSIIVIDELDLLINCENRVVRVLQERLDGVESNDDILVLTATNSLGDIPGPLLRHGRLEKMISVPPPSGENALMLFKKHYEALGLSYPEDFDDEEMILSLNGVNCVGIKSLVNDIVLRNGFDNITTEMIDESVNNIIGRVKSSNIINNLDVAIHEAGHAIVAKSFPQYFVVNRLTIHNQGGDCSVKEVKEGFWPYKKAIANIKISMAGLIAQKIITGNGSLGCDEDLQRARNSAYNLLNICGYSSCWETLPMIRQGARLETAKKRRGMERKIERLLRKCEKDTTKYIKAHREQIAKLGNLLLAKQHLKSSEIMAIVK